jgi:amidohydrolase
MEIKRFAGVNEDAAIAIRRHLHRNPELSGVELQTLAFIREKLTEYGVAFEEIEDGGLLGFIGEGERTVLLRADVDALPIRENPRNLKRERAVISQNDGVQHACGHDAHTAILLTAGKILRENPEALHGGRVILLFERGEEGTGNLRYVLEHFEREKTRIDAAHAIHVRPDLPAGRILAKDGPIMAGAFGFAVTIRGKGGHGSRPDLANNPIDCFVAVYNALSAIRLRYVSPFDRLTFSVGQLQSGGKSNVIPGELTFGGSARFYKKETGAAFAAEFKTALTNITAAYHCAYELTGGPMGLLPGSPLTNDDRVARLARDAAARHLGEDALIDAEPLMGSESFAAVAERWPSVMVHLGIQNDALGSGADLHSEFFDLDEAAIAVGVAETVAFATEFLQSGISQ